jgi:ATP-dependent DNA ligase
MAANKDGKRVRLLSRNGVDHSGRFPELVAAVAALPARTFMLDGPIRRLAPHGLEAWAQAVASGSEAMLGTTRPARTSAAGPGYGSK